MTENNFISIIIALIAAFALYSWYRDARGVSKVHVVPPPPRTRFFGIQIHPDVTIADFLLIDAIPGLRYVRCDIGRNLVEQADGMTYVWTIYDTIYDQCLKRGLVPIFITSMGAPTTTTEILDHVAFHALAAKRYPFAWWELGNEPNLAYFWPPKPDAKQYALVAKCLALAMRRGMAPTSKIISGGTSGIPLDFMHAYLSDGVDELIDYVGFHPYGIAPTDIPERLAELRAITSKPLFCTEFGDNSSRQADVLTGMATACGDNGVPFIWYELKDGVPNTIDPNNTFGLFMKDGVAKPSLISAMHYAGGAK